jgi:hypothetical protein
MLYGKFKCKCGKEDEGDIHDGICRECTDKIIKEKNIEKDKLWKEYYNKELNYLSHEERLGRIERWIFERGYVVDYSFPRDG